jgi:hypothetical protein
VTYNRANGKEPDDDSHDLHKIGRILSNLIIDLDLPQELQADQEVEDSTDTNWAEETDEKRLSLLLNLVNFCVHGKYDRRTSEKQNEDAKEDQAVYRYDAVVVELAPWADSSEPDEDGYIEKHINCGLERVVHSLETEPVAANQLAKL